MKQRSFYDDDNDDDDGDDDGGDDDGADEDVDDGYVDDNALAYLRLRAHRMLA